jgi:hypothetical protein
MPLRKLLNRFLDILLIELDGLQNDLIDLIQLEKERLQRHEITNYVFQENKGLMLNEMTCFKTLMGKLRELDTSRYGDVKEMVADVEEQIRKRTEECAYPQVVFNLVKRRIDKVYHFLTKED